MMDSDKLLRKNRRALLTRLRECCIFSIPITLVTESGNFQATVHKITENNPRSLELKREIAFSVASELVSNIELGVNSFLLVDFGKEFFRVRLNDISLSDRGACVATFTLDAATPSNRRSKERKKETVSYFGPIMLYTEAKDNYPIPGYARLIDTDDSALCLNLQFFQYIEESKFINAEILFQEKLLGIYDRKQKILKTRKYTQYQQTDTYITKVDAILMASQPDRKPSHHTAIIQPVTPFTVSFDCLLHEKKTIRANINNLLTEGFLLDIPEHDYDSLPSQLQVDHQITGLRFNALKLTKKLFISYKGLSLGDKTIWFNFITKYALNYDHCFTPKDVKNIIHLMFESGNYTSQAVLQLSLMNDYFQHKWPIEEAFSPTKYRWLVRDRQGNYIGHTFGVRVSETLWGAIDNIGSQSYTGSWNAEFVARWIRSFAELLTHTNQESWVQWTFVPEAGVWTRFDELLKSKKGLTLTRDRFWGVFLLNRPRGLSSPRRTYKSTQLGQDLSKLTDLTASLSDSQRTLLKLLSDGLSENSSFQIDFEREYGFRLLRHFHLIESESHGNFLLTFTNYPSWASLHKGHNWDYLFPLNPSSKIELEKEVELLDIVEETIFQSGCIPYRLAVVCPTTRLSSGVEWVNLSLHPDALEWAAHSLEKL